MHLIVAIVRPEKLAPIQAALKKRQEYLTVTQVRGHGHEEGCTMIYRNLVYQERLLEKLKLEIVIDDSLLEETVEAVAQAGGIDDHGLSGEGIIYVQALEKCPRLRAREPLAVAAQV